MSIWRWVARSIEPYLETTQHRFWSLEHRMSLSETALADLDDATNAVAAELDELRAEVENFDSDLAAKIGAKADRLRALASDPDNPVPAPPADPSTPDEPEAPSLA